MFSTCNATCVGSVTLPKTDQCDMYQRSEVPVRLLIAKCDFDFPTGLYDANALALAVEAAITAGDISVTPELADLQWADPTSTTKQYKGTCRPPSTINVSRQLTGKDFNACTKVGPERLGQDKAYVIDSTKAFQEFGWKPQITLDQGIQGVIGWVDEEWDRIEHVHRCRQCSGP